MTVVTINARVNTWSAEISNVVSDQPFERHFTVEGNIHRGTRFALGAELTGLFPGEAVFDELWNRNVYGGPMPSNLNLGIRAEGEVWQDGIVAWDTTLHPQLAVMSASFKATTTFVWPNG